jgi:hypothetical protein
MLTEDEQKAASDALAAKADSEESSDNKQREPDNE